MGNSQLKPAKAEGSRHFFYPAAGRLVYALAGSHSGLPIACMPNLTVLPMAALCGARAV